MVDPLVNSTITQAVLTGLTENFTGAEFLSVAIIVFGVFLLTVLMRIPLEFSLLFILPILFVAFAGWGGLGIILAVVLAIVALIMARALPIGR